MDEQQPELRWAPLPPQPKRTGRTWAIIGLVIAAVAVVAALLFFMLPRTDGTAPGDTPSPAPSTSPSGSATEPPSAEPNPAETPLTTPPPSTDPTLEVFRGHVTGWLDTAPRGLDIVAGANGEDALPVVDTLEQDAQRLSDARPPASISQTWRDGVAAYSQSLADLRAAVSNATGVSAAVDAARTAAQNLRDLVGL